MVVAYRIEQEQKRIYPYKTQRATLRNASYARIIFATQPVQLLPAESRLEALAKLR